MEDRFRSMTGARFASITEGLLAGGVPHRSFAVFCTYPYTGLLTDGRKAPHALTVLDRCRVRWGRLLAYTERHLAIVNDRQTRSAVPALLG
jgi:hypothetical protein